MKLSESHEESYKSEASQANRQTMKMSESHEESQNSEAFQAKQEL